MAGQQRLYWVLMTFFFLMVIAAPSLGLAADGSGGYLSGYEEADPKPSARSWLSTFAYLLSLAAVFIFVLVLAYFASKFLSGRFAKVGNGSGGKILEHLPLGPNRSVCVVELAGRVFMLGVTEHSINSLGEITDKDEIERLHRRILTEAAETQVLSRQMGLLGDLAKRIPTIFQDDYRK